MSPLASHWVLSVSPYVGTRANHRRLYQVTIPYEYKSNEDLVREQRLLDEREQEQLQLEEQLRELEVESSSIGMTADHDAAKDWDYAPKKKKLTDQLSVVEKAKRTLQKTIRGLQGKCFGDRSMGLYCYSSPL